MYKTTNSVLELFKFFSQRAAWYGIFPFQIDEKGAYKIHKLFFGYYVFLMSVIIGSDIYVYLNLPEIFFTKTVSHILWLLNVVSNIITLTTSIIWMCWNVNYMNSFLSNLISISERLNVKKFTANLYVTYIFMVIMLLSCFYGFWTMSDVPVFMRLVYYFKFVLVNSMVFVLGYRYAIVLRILKNFLDEMTKVISITSNAKSVTNVLKCYDLIVDCCSCVGYFYGPQIPLVILTSFLLILGNVYEIIIERDHQLLHLHIKVIVIYIFLNALLIHACNSTKNAAENFNKRLYQLALNDETGTISSNVKISLHIEKNKSLEFTAFGLFNVDYSIVTPMIASATTYLAIMLQYTSK